MSASVVRVPVPTGQIEAAERLVTAHLATPVRGRESSGAVGRVGVEFSSGAQLRLDPPTRPGAAASTPVSGAAEPPRLTLAYLAN